MTAPEQEVDRARFDDSIELAMTQLALGSEPVREAALERYLVPPEITEITEITEIDAEIDEEVEL